MHNATPTAAIATILLLCALPLGANSGTADRERILAAVKEKASHYRESLKSPWHPGFPSDYYFIQSDFQNALRYASATHDTAILDELSGVALASLKNLKRTRSHIGNGKSCFPAKLGGHYLMWLPPENHLCKGKGTGLPKENILDTAQYSYFLASLVNAIASQATLTGNMAAAIRVLPRLLAFDQYYRLVFGSKPFGRYGWGCGAGDFSGYQNVSVLKKRLYGKLPGATTAPPYCNAVTDTEILLLGGVAELVLASEKRYGVLYPQLKGLFEAYLAHGSGLLASRAKTYEISPGIWGQSFGAGDMDGHPDYRYAGYDGAAYPNVADKRSPAKTAWDISHARRIVHVFESLLLASGGAGYAYPSTRDMGLLANNFYHRVFNGDINNPKFCNFMDGTNGWYRVGYRGRANYGIGPYNLTGEAVAGGFGFWAKYNPNLGKAIQSANHNAPNDLQGLPSLQALPN
jgi:hypothetical protein